ncbi:transmembrane and coiled-coil domain-containing protein 4 [Corythoichthys intestinalis]|uniref:transmembrane and coiled-coil domain-containing protein 4 n=1 Tax=Corythoichthys intestinalis TaxID=161448 RepID=UPI0025A4E6EB|nr:transmembrane and coiled-coil domain-containing protein 4 [Corythoichthys intestinalis]XP_061803316.1 transmembrane and coiled-coil domain-containing protein 4 [Nerophis lumbriciformis]
MEEQQSSTDINFTPDPGGAKATKNSSYDQSPEEIISRQMSEQGRFAYAALCGVSLGHLFTGNENSAFREQYLKGLVGWLDLDESVMPVMGAFLSGLGFEGSDTFLSILRAEPLMATGAIPIIQDLVSFSVKDGHYDARARVLIRHVGFLLRVSPQELEDFEETLGEKLREGGEESEEESSRRQRRERGRKLRRYLLVGLATVGGGTLIGVTGGLAAPLVAAGAGAVLGAGGAAALGSATGIAIMASLFGAAGAGLTGYKMNKCVGAIEEFEFLPLSSGKHLHLTVTVTGWLCTGKYSSFQAPWCSLGVCGEQYCLVWESRFLRDLGSAMTSLLDGLVSMMAQEALKYTVLSGIVTALTWPASLLAAASVIDNPWCVCLNRSAEVGKHLAQVLRSRQQGKRPVSLIGFSLGARVIYFCLQELANEEGSEGVVEDVVLLGAPVDGSEKAWERITKVVAGKIVNGYCRGDWLLGFLYRSSAAQLCVAGLQPINIKDRRVINVDLSSVVKGHLDYMHQMDTILVAVGVPTKEVPGSSFVLPQPVTTTKGPTDTHPQAEIKHPLRETQSPILEDETCLADIGEESTRTTEIADGWDVPDISDLLDALNSEDNESETPPRTMNNIPVCQGSATDDRLVFNESDDEHVSWGWEDAHWTAEHSHTQTGPKL